MQGSSIRIVDGRQLPFAWFNQAVLTKFDLSQKAKLAYMALCCYATNSRKVASIPMKTLSASVSASETSMKEGIAELVRAGLVKVRRKTAVNRITTNKYNLPNEYTLVEVSEALAARQARKS